MKPLLPMLTLVGLIFLNCSHDAIVADSGFNFDDATGPPMKVVVSQGGTIANPETTISIGIPEPGDLKLTIHNCTGQRIVTLAEGYTDGGGFTYSWDAKNESGEFIKTGIYIYRLQFDGTTTAIIQYKAAYFLF